MISKEDFKTLVDDLKEKLDETSQALVSEELLALQSNYNNGFDNYTELEDKVSKLSSDKDELLKVNGKLYQQIGFEKKEDEKKEDVNDKKDDEIIEIFDVVDEKGELI